MDSNQTSGGDDTRNQAEVLLDEAETLIWSLLDDQIKVADIKRLEKLLQENDQVRNLYVQCVHMHVDLQGHFGKAPEVPGNEQLPKSPVLGLLGDLRPGTDTLPLRD